MTTIDRLPLLGSLTTEEAAARQRTVNEWLEAIDLVLLRTPVLSRAGVRVRCSRDMIDIRTMFLVPLMVPIASAIQEWRRRRS